MKSFKQYLLEALDQDGEFKLSARDEKYFEQFIDLAEELNDLIEQIRDFDGDEEELDDDDEMQQVGYDCVSVIEKIDRVCNKFEDEDFAEELRQFVVVAGDVYAYSTPSNYADGGEFDPIDIELAREMKDWWEKHGDLEDFHW